MAADAGPKEPPKRLDHRLARRGGAIEALRLPAGIFGCIARARGWLYDHGLMPSARLEVPVVSIGNLSAGGTGKTPFVLWLAAELVRRGRKPGVLSRGYKAAKAASKDQKHLNDEARMFALQLPDVPCVQNPDRVAGGLELIRQGVDLILLDDGFQHRRLGRDLDLVLIDATRPWGLPGGVGEADEVRALLPRGLLRELPQALVRAQVIVITRADQVTPDALLKLRQELQRVAPGPAILSACHRAKGLRGPTGELALPSTLRGLDVDLLSALGNPEGFEASVEALGASIHQHRTFPDHHHYVAGDLDGLGSEGRPIVTSAKDAVKLHDFPQAVHVLEIEWNFVEGLAVLEALLDALPPSHSKAQQKALHAGLHG